jgi:hypothetical protein
LSAIIEVETKLGGLLIDHEAGTLSDEEDTLIKELMIKQHDLLRKEESKWRQKSRAVWICEGDNNKKFIHKFSSFHK